MRKAESEAALTVRADGLSPNQVAVRMKRLFLMRLQWSIARGNARIAGAVGLWRVSLLYELIRYY